MNLKCRTYLLAIFCTLVSAPWVRADGGTDTGYAPYSKFGIGRLYQDCTPALRSMGGIGVALRDRHLINVSNPAAVTARDSLAFMAEFGINQDNNYYSQTIGGTKHSSVTNSFDISHFVMSFPIWKSSAFMLGIAPYSSVGYTFSSNLTDEEILSRTGSVTDAYTGSGGLYRLYCGAGVTFWKRLSLGAQFDYYFGSIEKYALRSFSSSAYRSIYKGTQMRLKSFSGKFGIQYEQPLFHKTDRITIGATCRIPTRLLGDNYDLIYTLQSDVMDTLRNDRISLSNTTLPLEVAVGISYRHRDRWSAEFNYSRSDWTKSGMSSTYGFAVENFDVALSQSFRAGFEYVPNRDDIRYYLRRCAYRIGAYYTQDYYKYCGNHLWSAGATIGVTFPVFRWLNGLSVAIDVGQRGSMKGKAMPGFSTIRENYVNFSVSVNIFDIWFIKPKYE